MAESDVCFAVVLSLLVSGEGVEHDVQAQHDQQHGKDQLQAVCDEHSAPSGLTGRMAQGADMQETTEVFFKKLLAIASGEQTQSEKHDYREIAIFKDGVTL